jgi:large subunit ribosomal protein L4
MAMTDTDSTQRSAADVSVPMFGEDLSRAGEMTLPGAVFGGRSRPAVVHAAVRMQMANRRRGTSSTTTRHFVSGGGQKPWRQKGTGRARAGSNRSPIWEGGAIVFGPQPRDYHYRMPRGARRAALKAALAEKVRAGTALVVESVSLREAKTKAMLEWLRGLDLDGTVLVVLADADVTVERATRNLPHAKALRVDGLNVYDVLRYRHLVLTKGAVARITERLS